VPPSKGVIRKRQLPTVRVAGERELDAGVAIVVPEDGEHAVASAQARQLRHPLREIGGRRIGDVAGHAHHVASDHGQKTATLNAAFFAAPVEASVGKTFTVWTSPPNPG
jgi:hypothetical protein